jgi:hypothetical protein
MTWIQSLFQGLVHGYLLTEIANHLELHPTTISRIVNQTGSYRLTRD